MVAITRYASITSLVVRGNKLLKLPGSSREHSKVATFFGGKLFSSYLAEAEKSLFLQSNSKDLSKFLNLFSAQIDKVKDYKSIEHEFILRIVFRVVSHCAAEWLTARHAGGYTEKKFMISSSMLLLSTNAKSAIKLAENSNSLERHEIITPGEFVPKLVEEDGRLMTPKYCQDSVANAMEILAKLCKKSRVAFDESVQNSIVQILKAASHIAQAPSEMDAARISEYSRHLAAIARRCDGGIPFLVELMAGVTSWKDQVHYTNLIPIFSDFAEALIKREREGRQIFREAESGSGLYIFKEEAAKSMLIAQMLPTRILPVLCYRIWESTHPQSVWPIRVHEMIGAARAMSILVQHPLHTVSDNYKVRSGQAMDELGQYIMRRGVKEGKFNANQLVEIMRLFCGVAPAFVNEKLWQMTMALLLKDHCYKGLNLGESIELLCLMDRTGLINVALAHCLATFILDLMTRRGAPEVELDLLVYALEAIVKSGFELGRSSVEGREMVILLTQLIRKKLDEVFGADETLWPPVEETVEVAQRISACLTFFPHMNLFVSPYLSERLGFILSHISVETAMKQVPPADAVSLFLCSALHFPSIEGKIWSDSTVVISNYQYPIITEEALRIDHPNIIHHLDTRYGPLDFWHYKKSRPKPTRPEKVRRELRRGECVREEDAIDVDRIMSGKKAKPQRKKNRERSGSHGLPKSIPFTEDIRHSYRLEFLPSLIDVQGLVQQQALLLLHGFTTLLHGLGHQVSSLERSFSGERQVQREHSDRAVVFAGEGQVQREHSDRAVVFAGEGQVQREHSDRAVVFAGEGQVQREHSDRAVVFAGEGQVQREHSDRAVVFAGEGQVQREHSDRAVVFAGEGQVQREHSDRAVVFAGEGQVQREHSDRAVVFAGEGQVQREHSDRAVVFAGEGQVQREHSDRAVVFAGEGQVQREHSDKQVGDRSLRQGSGETKVS